MRSSQEKSKLDQVSSEHGSHMVLLKINKGFEAAEAQAGKTADDSLPGNH